MAYSPPSIGSAGLTIPSFSDILADLVAQFLLIYGADTYLGIETDDYQMLSAFAAKIADTMLLGQLVYNQRGPASAIGVGLDGIVKINGIARKAASYSTCVLTVTGINGTVIIGGVAQDINGVLWDLPNPTTIVGGSIMVTATCESIGAITANIGDIGVIATPTAGWVSITNGVPAVAGVPIELDSQLRARQAISVALPSRTMLAGTVAGIATVSGVTRYNVLENYFSFTASFGVAHTTGTDAYLDTGFPLDSTDVGESITIDGSVYTVASIVSGTHITITPSAGALTGVAYFIGDGIELGPPHSITAVVEGGTDAAVAQAIYDNKGIGCFPNGTTTVVITDPTNGNTSQTIGFDRPTYATIYTAVSIHPLVTLTGATLDAIVAGITNYLNTLQIGEAVIVSELYGAALTARSNPDLPTFSIRGITVGLNGGLAAIALHAIGTGYHVSDVLTVVQGGASGGTVTVATINGGGGITALVGVSAAGTGYIPATGLATTGGFGTGATIDLTNIVPPNSTDIPIPFDGVALGVSAGCYVIVV